MHRFYLEGPNSVSLCSPLHLVYCVCRKVPTVCAHYCTTSFCVCLEGPIWFVLTNAPLLTGGAQICFPVLTNAPRLFCLPEGPNLYVLTTAPRLSVSVWIGPKSVLVLTKAPCQ